MWFSCHFGRIIVRYKKIGYNIDVLRQTACLVVDPIKVGNFAYLFGCATVDRASGWVAVPSWVWLGSSMDGWWLAPVSGCLGSGLSWFDWWVLLLRIFGVGVSVGPRVCFVLDLILVSMFQR